MVKVIFGLFALVFSTAAIAAVTATLDRHAVDETDTVELTVRVDTVNVSGAPDLTVLEQDFDIVTQRTNSQYRSVNGQVEAFSTWVITLRPKRTGTLTIPPITVGNARTEALRLRVTPLDPEVKRRIEQRVFFETTASPESVYVQAQLEITRRLYYADGVQLYGDMPATPVIADAIVEPLGSPRSYTTVRDGRRYGVIEQRFAVFPEASGTIVIPSARVTGSVRLPSSTGYGYRRSGVQVASEAMTIEVLPIPAEYPAGEPWLPSTDVDIVGAFDTHRVDRGQPVARTLIVRAENCVGSIIPPLDVDFPDTLKVYPEPPVIESTVSDGTLVGRRKESYSVVPVDSGVVELPAVRITWWDTVRRQVRTAGLDASRLTVAASALSPVAPAVPATDTRETSSAAETSPSLDRDDAGGLSATIAYLVAALALAGWAATAFAWWRFANRDRPGSERSPPPPRNREPAARRALEAAVRLRDPRRIKHTLGRWAAAHFETDEVRGLRTLNRNESTHESMVALNAALYGSAGTAFDGRTLLARIEELERPPRDDSDGIPALYPVH